MLTFRRDTSIVIHCFLALWMVWPFISAAGTGECLSEPCFNNGTCIEEPFGFSCLCPPMYYGVQCETEEDICLIPPGTSSLYEPLCECDPGYTGWFCESEYCPCENGHCEVYDGELVCFCYTGWVGELCDQQVTAPSQVDVFLCDGCQTCTSYCAGVPDGQYRSCEQDTDYVLCTGGVTQHMKCPPGLRWDDQVKACIYWSKVWTNCVSDCHDMPDGDYHSCHACCEYNSCSKHQLISRRKCPAALVWDDTTKRCEWKSKTCGISKLRVPHSVMPLGTLTQCTVVIVTFSAGNIRYIKGNKVFVNIHPETLYFCLGTCQDENKRCECTEHGWRNILVKKLPNGKPKLKPVPSDVQCGCRPL